MTTETRKRESTLTLAEEGEKEEGKVGVEGASRGRQRSADLKKTLTAKLFREGGEGGVKTGGRLENNTEVREHKDTEMRDPKLPHCVVKEHCD